MTLIAIITTFVLVQGLIIAWSLWSGPVIEVVGVVSLDNPADVDKVKRQRLHVYFEPTSELEEDHD